MRRLGQRLTTSISNALANGSVGTNNAIELQVQLTTSNNITAPYIDTLGTSATFTYNECARPEQLSGYYVNISNVVGTFVKGELVTQGGVSGVADGANSSYIRVNSQTGTFAVNASAITGATSGATANVTTVTYFDETKTNGFYKASRYISKNVILADKQDAEDLLVYTTAYRPVGTTFNVYGKFLNAADTDAFSSKDWSLLQESSLSYALFSSSVNRNDLIELQFALPNSTPVDTSLAITSSNTTITVADTSKYVANTFIYLADQASTKFNVRKVAAIVNNSTMTLASNASFTSANVAVGNIPNLQSQFGVFLYANNNNIARYVTASDVVFDTYKTFAVKIVPVTNNSIMVPIMSDLRCLALQV